MADNNNTNTKEYLLKKKMNELKNFQFPFWVFHLLTILVGIILIILGTVEIKTGEVAWIPESLKTIFVGFGQALFIGMVISIIMDLPFMKNYFRSRIVDVLVGEEYLNSLDHERLEKLRTDCTEKIYIKDTVHFDKSLLALDDQITRLLSKPYVVNYRHDVVCSRVQPGVLLKKSSIKYWLANPTGTEVIENFIGKIWLYEIQGKNGDELFKIRKFKIKIDNGNELDILGKLKYSFKANTDSSAGYQLQVSVTNDDGSALYWKYKDKLEIELEDERMIPESDNIYIKRISDNPVKSLHINYKMDGVDCRLEGTCFGTLAQVSTGEIRVVRQDHAISIESFSWLLPGNGILIAALPK